MNLLARAKKSIDVHKNLNQLEVASARRKEAGKESTIVLSFRKMLEMELANPRVSGDVYEDVQERIVEAMMLVEKIPEDQARQQVREVLEKSKVKKEFEPKIYAAYDQTLSHIARTVVEIEGKPLLESGIKSLIDHMKESAKRDQLPAAWLEERLRTFEHELVTQFRSIENQGVLEKRLFEALASILSPEDARVIQREFQENGIQHLPRIESEYTLLIDHLIARGKIPESTREVWKQLLKTECLLKLSNEREVSFNLFREHTLKENAREAQSAYTRQLKKFQQLSPENQTKEQIEVLKQFKFEQRKAARAHGRMHKNKSLDLPSVVSVVEQYFPNEGRRIIKELRTESNTY